MPPSTAGCGGPPTSRAAHSAWPPSSATTRHAPNPRSAAPGNPAHQRQQDQPDPTRSALTVEQPRMSATMNTSVGGEGAAEEVWWIAPTAFVAVIRDGDLSTRDLVL